jgi:Holliday junction resolvasome RuvABC endonuclease subunit
MRILALDLGTKTGWAWSDGVRVESGVNTLVLRKEESPGMRYVRFRKWFDDMCLLSLPDVVVCEKPHLRGFGATHFLTNLLGRVEEECAIRGVQHSTCHTGTLKKHATGYGNASKDEMVKIAQAIFSDRLVADDNEADALLLLAWARDTYEPKKSE